MRQISAHTVGRRAWKNELASEFLRREGCSDRRNMLKFHLESRRLHMSEDKKPLANPQPDSADKPPIPQPATDGFPAGDEDFTSRVPGGDEEIKEENPPE